MTNGIKICDLFQQRLQRITTANGFTTDAGNNLLFVGRDSFDPKTLSFPAVVIHALPAISAGSSGGPDITAVSNLLIRDFTFEGLARPTSRDDWFDQSETMIADIMKAIHAKGVDIGQYRSIGIKSVKFSGSEIAPPPDAENVLTVAVTVSVTYLENF